MTTPSPSERWEAEVKALQEELRRMRAEQREMAAAIQDLVTTFRTLAAHLGIAAEPYVRKDDSTGERDIPGFG
jgi:hypothetical protein